MSVRLPRGSRAGAARGNGQVWEIQRRKKGIQHIAGHGSEDKGGILRHDTGRGSRSQNLIRFTSDFSLIAPVPCSLQD